MSDRAGKAIKRTDPSTGPLNQPNVHDGSWDRLVKRRECKRGSKRTDPQKGKGMDLTQKALMHDGAWDRLKYPRKWFQVRPVWFGDIRLELIQRMRSH